MTMNKTDSIKNHSANSTHTHTHTFTDMSDSTKAS
jgi:hypothetical protein